MQLSVNYSVELETLLRQGKVKVDRIKCPDWPDMIATARKLAPVYVHFPLDAGSTTGRPPNFADADRMARETDTPFVNLHLVTWQRDFPDHPADSSDPALLDRVAELMLAHVAQAEAVVGRERLIIENIPYFGPAGEFHRASVEPSLIRRVIDQSGCGFLLDLSHARIAAHYLGVDAHDYVAQLPVDRLRELHVTGVRQVKTRLADHMDLGDEDWAWVTLAMQRIRAGDWSRPWTVALEYGGVGAPFTWRSEQRVLEEQVPRLYEMVRG
ncbi:MAG: DUF692 family multinuclear iron-containing protein [Tepidisphaeraceae bacterium]